MARKNIEDKKDCGIGNTIVLPEDGLRFEEINHYNLGYHNRKDNRVTNK